MYNLDYQPLKNWVTNKFISLKSAQIEALDLFKKNQDVLITSPTGSGKTLAAFLGIFDELYLNEQYDLQVIYVCPLKALVNDVQKNIDSFIEEINENSEFKIHTTSKTGDKKLDLKIRAQILFTTPESLSILLVKRDYEEYFKNLKYIIVDEVHALAENKRGTELSINIARLKMINQNLRTIGLSATVEPINEVAKFLFNHDKYHIVKGYEKKITELVCKVPKQKSYEDLSLSIFLMEKNIAEIVKEEDCTLIFVNTRSAAENLVFKLQKLLPEYLISAHHSSMSKAERFKVESLLKEYKIKVVVSSCSLEQGIDIDSITKVIQCYSPRQISKAIQRIGRAGHQLDKTTKGTFFALTRCEAIEICVILNAINNKYIDKINIPRNCFDMLAQGIVNLCFNQSLTEDEIYDFVSSISVYKEFAKKDLKIILDYLTCEHREDKNKRFFARLRYDDESKKYFSYHGLKKIEFFKNVGSIVAQTYLTVKCKNKQIGFLDEKFLHEIKKGDIFTLGGKRYIFLYNRGSSVFVEESHRDPSFIPAWVSENLPISFEVGTQIVDFRSKILNMLFLGKNKEDIFYALNDFHLDDISAIEIYDHFLKEYLWLNLQKIETNLKDKILLEIVPQKIDEQNMAYFVFHLCFGQRLNTLIALILSDLTNEYVKAKYKKDINLSSKASNNGIIFIASQKDKEILKDALQEVYKRMLAMEDSATIALLNKAIPASIFFMNMLKKNAKRSLSLIDVGTKSAVPSYVLLNSMKNPNNINFLETVREITYDYLNFDNFVKAKQGPLSASLLITESEYFSPFAHGVIYSNSNVDTKISSDFLINVNNKITILCNQHFFIVEETDKYIIKIFEEVMVLYLKEENTVNLIIGDPHLGFDYNVRIAELNVLAEQCQNLVWLLQLIGQVDRVIVLGDIKDSIIGTHYNELDDVRYFLNFIESHCKQVILLKGNHDSLLEKQLNYECHEQLINPNLNDGSLITKELILGDFLLTHGHRKIDHKNIIMGHEHPKVTLQSNNIKIPVKSIMELQDDNRRIFILPSINTAKSGRESADIKLTQDKKFNTNFSGKNYIFYKNKWISQGI